MKITKAYVILCIINIIKIIVLLMVMGDILSSNFAIGCSLPSLFVFLAMAIDDNLKYISLMGIIGVIILWGAIIIISFIGMKNRKMQIVALFITTIATLLDLLLPIIFSSIEIKLGAALMSTFVLSLSIKVWLDLKKKE